MLSNLQIPGWKHCCDLREARGDVPGIENVIKLRVVSEVVVVLFRNELELFFWGCKCRIVKRIAKNCME